MQINIDVDNTINDFIYKFVYYLNGIQNSGEKFKVENMKEYNLRSTTNLSAESLDILFFKNNTFHNILDPLCGSIEVIRMLQEAGHIVKFVTSISYDVIQSRIEFFKKHFPFVDVDSQLIVTHDKTSIYADIVIDDHIPHLTNINHNCTFIIFDQPWNQEYEFADYRVHDWCEVRETLEKIGLL